MSIPTLPDDILAEIWDYLCTDLNTLRSCAVTCKAFVSISQYHLHKAVDFNFLQDPQTESVRECVTELRVSPRSERVASSPDVVIQAALGLPRLTALAFNTDRATIRPQTTPFASAVRARLSEFKFLTELTLYRTSHTSLEDVWDLILALPNLTRLVVCVVGLHKTRRNITALYQYVKYDYRPPVQTARPSLKYLRAMPNGAVDTTMAIVRWLSYATPTQDTLRTLHVPAKSKATLTVVQAFGPSIRHLIIEELESVADPSFISRYTNLESLELGGISKTASWIQLSMLVHSIRSPKLRKVELNCDASKVPVDKNITGATDRILFSMGLERVCFIVEGSPNTLTVEKMEDMRKTIKEQLYRLEEAGKLLIEFQRRAFVT